MGQGDDNHGFGLPANFDPFGKGTSQASGGLDTVRDVVTLGGKLVRAVVHQSQRRAMREARRQQRAEMDDQIADTPPIHGSAAWATSANLRAADLLQPDTAIEDPSSILLGAFEEDGRVQGYLHWDDEGHLVTVAPTRSGKSTMQIIPNLLRYRGSCVVLDPKGELYAKTSEWRRSIEQSVYRIAPFEDATDAFNPMDMVRSPADARALADLMIPEDPNAQEYFRKDAIAFLNGVIQYVKKRESHGPATIAKVREVTSLPSDTFLLVAQEMSLSEIPAIANAGNIVLGKSKDRGLPALRDTLNTELSMWDDPGVQRATRNADFRFHDLKDRPTTVYITVPFDKMKAFAPFLRVLLASALEAMVQNPTLPDIDVLFVLDEFLSLGSFPQFRDAIRTHAGSGVRLWFFLQNLSVLEELYPRSWRAFFDASVQSFFGIKDIYTGGVISDILGETTIAHRTTSYSISAGLSQQDFFEGSSSESLNVSHNVSITGRKLLTPAEVVQKLSAFDVDGTRTGILAIAGSRPVQALLVPYFAGDVLKHRVGPERG
jgi:type IV secretion system protein VirD4